MSDQIDAFPDIPSHKKVRNHKPVSALEKVQKALGPYGYFEEKIDRSYNGKTTMIEVGICDKEFPYKKHKLARAASIDSALAQVPSR